MDVENVDSEEYFCYRGSSEQIKPEESGSKWQQDSDTSSVHSSSEQDIGKRLAAKFMKQ